MRYGWVLGALLLLFVACGDSTLFSDAPAIGAGSGGSGQGGTSSADVSSSSSSSNVSSSSSTGGASGPGPTTTTGPGGGANVGGAGATGVGGSGGMGGAPGDPSLECGSENCPVQSGSACCWDAYQVYGAPRAECVMGNTANDGCATPQDDSGIETLIECQTADHCTPGQVCCGTRERITYNNQEITLYVETSCHANCEFPDILLCDNPGGTAGCPLLPTDQGGMVQSECQQSQLLPTGYYVCGYP